MLMSCNTVESGFPICSEWAVGNADPNHPHWCFKHYAQRMKIARRRAKNKVGRRQRQRTR